MVKNSALSFNFTPATTDEHYSTACITIDKNLTKKVYDFITINEARKSNPYGFHQTTATPLEYIEKNLRGSIINNLKEFLLRYLVLNNLYKNLRENHIPTIGSPLLENIKMDPDFNLEFRFKIMAAQAEQTMDWHYSLFKLPPRKHYKDLDKRAKEFIEEETTKETTYPNINTVQVGDWINFKIWLCQDGKPLLPEEPSELWLKIGGDEINIPFQELFVGKKIGEEFITNNLCIQEYFNSQTDNNYQYLIKIEDIVYNHFFSIENFKRHFKIKTNKAALQKIIEVFSSTNDLSLRKNIMEQLFNFLLTKHQINLPKQALVRQQRIVIENLQANPDYGVYKLQRDFATNVCKLALRQLNEIILADYIGFQEQLEVDQNDLKAYLNLTLRPRTREFIYFKHAAINTNEQEWPIPSEMLKTMCLKEKTINHILQILS